MEIEVTQHHINTGCRRTSGHCPLALALRPHAHDRGYSSVHVTTQRITFHRYESIQRFISTPYHCTQFMYTYDTQGPRRVKPFTFTIPDLPNYKHPYHNRPSNLVR